MRPRHSRDEILDGALRTALEGGLSQLTYGRVAKRLGINDRVVVYYFASKEELVGEVLVTVGLQLQATLAPAFERPAADHLELARRTWPVVATAEADPVFALFFEANGLAAAGRAPFDEVVPQLVAAWLDWAEQLIDGAPRRRRAEAEAAIALIDGLLLLRQLAGPEAAQRAAKRLGVA
jgi:AcrR family transcriptional regulator